jgi:hypothetical protein
MQSCATHSFLEALVYINTKAADKSKTAYLKVSFPKLRYIDLNCTGCAETTGMGVHISQHAIGLLMERCEINEEVQVLRLDHCYNDISGYDIEGLTKDIVVEC